METTSSIKHSVEKYLLLVLPFDFQRLGQNFKIPIIMVKCFLDTVPERLSDPVRYNVLPS